MLTGSRRKNPQKAYGIPGRQLAFLRWCHRLIHRSKALAERLDKTPPSEPRLPEDARAAAVDILERALAMARAEHVRRRDASR